MRPQFLTSALLLLVSCSSELPAREPPLDSFAYPSALVHVPPASGTGNGVLYVASSNFDKLYDNGAVMAVDLDALTPPIPDFDAQQKLPVGRDDAPIPLNVTEANRVLVRSITGDMALWRSPVDGGQYLFIPSRSEDDLLQVIRADGASLGCVGTESRNCATRAISLTESADSANGLPGAPAPIGVAIGHARKPGDRDELWVTHISAALTRTGENRQDTASTYVVKSDPEAIVEQLEGGATGTQRLPPGDFVTLTAGGSLAGGHTVAVGPDFAFLTGRAVTAGQGTGGTPPFLLRAVNRTTPNLSVTPNLRTAYPDIEARGVALSSDGTRLYVAGRATGSTLLVAEVSSTETTLNLSVVRAIDSLPPGASAVAVLSRSTPAGKRGDLVLITCSGAGVLAIYDDEVGDIVAQVPDLGLQPYGLAVHARPHTRVPDGVVTQGARVYVGNFADGRVNVIDIEDLDRPQEAHLVARLGEKQKCAVDSSDDACPEGSK